MPAMPQPFDLASLFSGGGLGEHGFCRAGFRLRWACEIDRKARAVHRRHFPGATMFHDVREVCGRDLTPVDVLLFGSPCQDLSVAGNRAGLAGERSSLFFEAMRICDEMAALPPVAIWENVSGALSSRGGRDFGTVLREMARRWRGVAYRILDLQWFGVPQRRRRVYVVGHSGGWERAAAVLFEPDGLRWDPPTRRAARQGVAAAVTAGARECDRGGGGQENLIAFGGNNTSGPVEVAARLGCNESGSGYRLDFESDTLVCGALCSGGKAAGSATQQDAECGGLVAHALRGEGFDASEDGTGRGTPLVPVAVSLRGRQGGGTAELSGEVAPAMRASKGGGDKPHALVAFQDRFRGDDGRGYDRAPPVSADMIGSLETVKPWHVATPMAVRRFMPVECERLMGIPDGYTAWGIDDDGRRIELADGPRYKTIGNGIGDPHGYWLGDRVAADLRECGRGETAEVATS